MTEIHGHHQADSRSAAPFSASLVDAVLTDAQALVGRRLSDYHRTMLVEVVHTLPGGIERVEMRYSDGELVFVDTVVVDSVRRSAILAFPEFQIADDELRLNVG